MDIQAIYNQISPPLQTTSYASSTVGKEDFLKLLVSQLQHQDPLNPQDPAEFTAQLTQFSSLEQLMNINKTFESMAAQQAMSNMMTASSFIGRQATALGDAITWDGTATSSASFDLPRDSAETTVSIYSESGALVRTISLGAVDAGEHAITWDGLTSSGTTAAAGDYYFEITAADSSGSAITATPMIRGTVEGVHFENGEAMLEIAGQSWPLSYLMSVGPPAATS